MKTRSEAARYAERLLNDDPLIIKEKSAWHFGKVELRILFDFIYEGKPHQFVAKARYSSASCRAVDRRNQDERLFPSHLRNNTAGKNKRFDVVKDMGPKA